MNLLIIKKYCRLPMHKHTFFKKSASSIVILFLTYLLSACQLTSTEKLNNATQHKNTFSYSNYYLWIKTLNKQELLAEEAIQNDLLTLNKQDNLDSQSKLILIYSLPYTSLHRLYKAKRLLNEHLLVSNDESIENVAFTMVLRDQLNYQLTLLSKKEAEYKDYEQVVAEDQLLIHQLESQLKQINQQLILLKRIDKNLNERG